MKNLNQEWYKAIVKERDERLEKAKEEAEECNCNEADTFAFIVAHGMTECLRIFDKVSAKHHLPLYHKFVKLLWGDELTDEEIKEQYTVDDFVHADLIDVADMFLSVDDIREALKVKATYDDFSDWYWGECNKSMNKVNALTDYDNSTSLTEYVMEKRNA